MLNQEIIEKMLSKFRSEELITTNNLIQYGLTTEAIEDAKKNNVIKEVSDGLYEFISTEDIYKHGLYQLQENDVNRAKYCFKKCYELDNNHTKAIKELLYLYIKTNEYFEMYKLLEKLKLENSSINIEDINLYQYLFNLSTQTIDKYHKNAKYISKEEILSKQENDEENKIRELIYEDKLLPAMKALNTLNLQDKKFTTIERKTLRALLSNAITESQTVNKRLIRLAKEERYNEMSTYLTEISIYRNLKISDKYSLFLLKQIENIIRTKEIPTPVVNLDTTNMFQAMDDYDFELAKNLNEDYLSRYNLPEENLLTILLSKLNELINKLKETKENITSIESTSKEKEINVSIEIPKETNKTTKLTDVIMLLLQGNVDEFTKILKKYLDESGYQKYEYLIMKLIKISLLNNDNSYLKPISILTEIDRRNYNFEPSIYIQEFYNTLSKDLLEQSEIYLEILFVYYDKNNLVVTNLINTLNEAKSKIETLERLTDKTISDKIDTLIEDKKINSISTMQEEKELVKSKIAELKSKGNVIGIIKDIPWERRKKIHTIAKEFDNLVTYGIGKEPKLIIFRLTDPNQERQVFKESLDDFFRGVKTKDYQYRIEIANKLLKDKRYEPTKHKDPRAFFATLGKLYLGTKDIENAITYLTIANEYNKMDTEPLRKYDFEEILEELQNPNQYIQPTSTKVEKKVQPKQQIKQEKDYTLTELQDIAYLIDEEKNTDEEAILKYSLKEEHLILIKLIYVRDFYIDGMYASGDKLLKEVEKSKIKSELIISFIKEIKINKRFYQNQTEKHTKKRKLTN